MNWTPPFNSHLILDERIRDVALRAYYVGFDQQQFRLEPLAKVIMDVLPEFALGVYQGASVPVNEVMPRLRAAALRIYSTDKYQRRGEFGELILHLLLRDFCQSIPLVSKIYFKDADNVPVHGFDAIHVVVDGQSKQLWLGESKLYDDGPSGIASLLEDLKTHVEADYLRKEFALISPKLPDSHPDVAYWRNQLHENQKLETILDSVCIPMVCTYTGAFYGQHSDNTTLCLDAFAAECIKLRDAFHSGVAQTKTKVRVLLLLLPVASKANLVTALHKRLQALQAI